MARCSRVESPQDKLRPIDRAHDANALGAGEVGFEDASKEDRNARLLRKFRFSCSRNTRRGRTVWVL